MGHLAKYLFPEIFLQAKCPPAIFLNHSSYDLATLNTPDLMISSHVVSFSLFLLISGSFLALTVLPKLWN